jgi:hypothetical protein
VLNTPKWILFICCTSATVTIFVGFINSTIGEPSTSVITLLRHGILWDYGWLDPPWDLIRWPFIIMNGVFTFLILKETWLGKLLGIR